jgi:hypothetical protein
MRGLGAYHEGDASRLHRHRQENDPFLVFAAAPGLRLFYEHSVGKEHRKTKNVKRPRRLTSSFTLQERGRMSEIGADQCHFVMPFTCTETQCTNECRVEGWRGSFWTAGGRGHLAATRWRPTVDDRKPRQSGYIEVTAHGESAAYSRQYAVGRSGCLLTYGLQRTYMIVRSGHTDTAVVPAERACDRQTQAVLWRRVPCAVRTHFWSLPSPVPGVAAAGAPAGASPV